MGQVQVDFHRLASQEFRSAREWYRQRSELAASRFRKEVDYAVQRIVTEGNSLPIAVGKFRQVRVRRFPYVLIFRERSPLNMLVVAVAHTSRRPKYWQQRT